MDSTASTILSRLDAEISDPEAFPRPLTATRNCFAYLANSLMPATTEQIASVFPTMTIAQATTGLQQLAGLLALYGAPFRLNREQVPHKKVRIYQYALIPA